MKLSRFILVAFLSAMLPSTHGVESWQKDGERAADTASMKSKHGFGAQFFLTQDTGVIQKWNTPETPRIAPVAKARRDLPILTVLLFAGPGTDSSGRADVTCDLIAYKPDGGIYGQELNAAVWKREYSAPSGSIQLSETYMRIRIEPKDPAGTYTVEARVHDHIKKVNLVLRTTVQVPR